MKNTLLKLLLCLSVASLAACSSDDSPGDGDDTGGTTSDTGGGASDTGGGSDAGGGEDTGGGSDAGGGEDTGGGDCDDPATWYADSDGDGLGDPAVSVEACDAPAGFVDNGDDTEPLCATNDTDECGVCAGGNASMDCNGECGGSAELDDCGVCEGPGGTEYFEDADGDGLGDPDVSETLCEATDGWVDNADDLEPACETNDTDDCGVCAGGNADMDCNGLCFGDGALDACGVCDGPGEATWYEDVDGDDLGDPATATVACEAPGEGWVANGDDAEPTCTTNDTDACGICGGPGATTYYADTDGDGLGDPADATDSCEPLGDGYVTNGDDTQPDCTSNDTDVCGECGGPGMSIWYPDTDGDGLGVAEGATAACAMPAGYADNSDDPEPDCATNDTDSCGVCAGGDADLDCNDECFGTASIDDCGVCSGGSTGIEPAIDDVDGDGIPDACDDCVEGRPGTLIVQWTEVEPYNAGGGPYTFQARLYADGRVTFQYADVEPLGSGGTYGMQYVSGVPYVETGVGSAFPVDNPSTWFTPITVEGEPRYELDYFQPLDFVDIADVGTALELGDDDFATVEIPFEFRFYDAPFTSVNIGSNGVLHFAGDQPTFRNTGLPNVELGAFIAPFWTDLNPTAGGTVHWFVDSGSCEEDCNGVQGGFASIDDCGVCTGGDTGLAFNADLDCNGECFGTAYLDVCNICVEGSTGVDPSDPDDCPTGVDLVIDEAELARDVYIDYVDVSEGDCLIAEGCVGGPGLRRVVRFSTMIGNIGTDDLQLGRPSEDNPNWIWDDCHSHWHFDDYAAYDLYDVAADEVLPIGSKNGFCVLDIGPYMGLTDRCNGYNCGNQGITAGCQDTYSSSLQCQWIDVTDVEDGIYEIVVTTNPEGDIPELDTTNNSSRVRISLEGDAVTVIPSP